MLHRQAIDSYRPLGISGTTGAVGVPTAELLEPKSPAQKTLEETAAPVAFLVNAEEHSDFEANPLPD